MSRRCRRAPRHSRAGSRLHHEQCGADPNQRASEFRGQLRRVGLSPASSRIASASHAPATSRTPGIASGNDAWRPARAHSQGPLRRHAPKVADVLSARAACPGVWVTMRARRPALSRSSIDSASRIGAPNQRAACGLRSCWVVDEPDELRGSRLRTVGASSPSSLPASRCARSAGQDRGGSGSAEVVEHHPGGSDARARRRARWLRIRDPEQSRSRVRPRTGSNLYSSIAGGVTARPAPALELRVQALRGKLHKSSSPWRRRTRPGPPLRREPNRDKVVGSGGSRYDLRPRFPVSTRVTRA